MPQAFARLHPVSATFSSYWSPLIYSPSVTCWDHLKSVYPAPPCSSLFLLLLPTATQPRTDLLVPVSVSLECQDLEAGDLHPVSSAASRRCSINVHGADGA